MGQRQSKDESLYEQASNGNIEGIKALHGDGAGLEWIDKEGKTPLILACMNAELHDVSKTLIELGANANAYRPGRHAGTPLHHAAKRGLENTVKLLLSHGANPLVMNDDCQTPLEVARAKGCHNVVRTIESHICLFSGWMREFYGPGFLELFAPRLLSRRVWVVVLPSGSRNPTKPFKLELAVYPSLQDAQPRTLITLWKANLEEPKFNLSDPSVIIVDNSTMLRSRRQRRRSRRRPQIVRQARIKLAPANEGDRQQLQWFCDACKGIPQAAHPPVFLHNSRPTNVQATAPPASEDLELAMAMSASLQSAMNYPYSVGEASSSTSSSVTVNHISHIGPSTSTALPSQKATAPPVTTQDSTPSAPSFSDDNILEDVGPIHYPSVDSSSVGISSSTAENLTSGKDEKNRDGNSSTCVVCLDAPSEAACVPCGHVSGCMSCLNEIKAKKWGCPVCRAKIDQVIRLYHV